MLIMPGERDTRDKLWKLYKYVSDVMHESMRPIHHPDGDGDRNADGRDGLDGRALSLAPPPNPNPARMCPECEVSSVPAAVGSVGRTTASRAPKYSEICEECKNKRFKKLLKEEMQPPVFAAVKARAVVEAEETVAFGHHDDSHELEGEVWPEAANDDHFNEANHEENDENDTEPTEEATSPSPASPESQQEKNNYYSDSEGNRGRRGATAKRQRLA